MLRSFNFRYDIKLFLVVNKYILVKKEITALTLILQEKKYTHKIYICVYTFMYMYIHMYTHIPDCHRYFSCVLSHLISSVHVSTSSSGSEVIISHSAFLIE